MKYDANDKGSLKYWENINRRKEIDKQKVFLWSTIWFYKIENNHIATQNLTLPQVYADVPF